MTFLTWQYWGEEASPVEEKAGTRPGELLQKSVTFFIKKTEGLGAWVVDNIGTKKGKTQTTLKGKYNTQI